MYVNILTTSSQLANNLGNYHGVDTSEEYSTEYFRLHECRNAVEQAEKAIKFEGLFTWEEQQKNLETVSQVRNRLNLLDQKLHQHGKREGIELIL